MVRNPDVSSPSLERQPASTPETRGAGLTVDVVVLSADLPLFDAIRAALEDRSPVWRARSAEEAVDLLLTGRCGVLVMDMALVATQPATLVERVVEQFPDVVVVVAGRRDDEGLLARLISEGHVYRFMHKPLTAKRAGMFLNAAMRCHAERRGLRAAEQQLPLVPRFPPRLDPLKWLFVTVGVAIFVMLLSLLPRGDGGDPRIEQAAAPPVRPTARSTPVAPLADPVLSRARAAFAAGRYEAPPGRNALDLYSAVLLARPNHPEARVGLERTIAQIIALAEQAHGTGRDDEARRILRRIRAADPGNTAVAELAALLEPPPDTSPPAPAPADPSEPTAPPPRTAPRATTAAKSAPAGRAAAPLAPSRPAAATARPGTGTVTPDPLTPRVTNAEALRSARAGPPRRVSRPLVFGPPVSSGHPIAGYARDADAGPSLRQPAPTDAVASAAVPPTASDALERVAAPDPVYPPDALRNGVEGRVELAFTVTETGSVRDIEIVEARPSGVFDAAATQALAQWRFRPRLVNGQPVAQRSVVTLRFSVER